MTATDAGLLGFMIGVAALGLSFVVASRRSRREPIKRDARTQRLARQPDHWRL